VYSLEIAQIAKSMVAEFFYALVILAIVSSWKWWVKGSMMAVCSILVVLCHYTIGVLLILTLLGIFSIRICTNWSKWKLFAEGNVPLVIILGLLILCAGGFYIFYGYVAEGVMNQKIGNLISTYTNAVSKVPSTQIHIEGGESTLQAAVGLDFTAQPIEGKVFRCIQYITQFFIIAGSLFLLFKPNRYRFTAEFVAGIGVGWVLLLCCMVIPGFSNVINMTRFYHMSLFFLAPMLVIGVDGLLKWIAK
jgi:uncharacterized membrane protein